MVDLDVAQLTQLTHRAYTQWKDQPRRQRQRRYGLALAGGGIVGGMFEVGAMAALEERLGDTA
jgi:predicted acylesterase/phospholipase RssA